MNARSIVNKVVDLEHILVEHDPHAVIITETWLNPSILNSEIIPPGYKLFRKDRESRGGGVAIVVKDCLDCEELDGAPDIENKWCKIKIGKVECILGAAYRPPGMGVEFVNNLNDFLDQLHAHSRKVIIAGDFNLGSIDWDGLVSTSNETLVSSAFLDMLFRTISLKLLKLPREFRVRQARPLICFLSLTIFSQLATTVGYCPVFLTTAWLFYLTPSNRFLTLNLLTVRTRISIGLMT